MNIENFFSEIENIENNVSEIEPSKVTDEALEVMYTIDALLSEAEQDEDDVRIESLKRIQSFVRKAV